MDSTLLIRAFLALIFVSGLIVLIAFMVKKLGLNYPLVRSNSGKRLVIEEMSIIDPKRRLVLVRRDNVEHLLLLGVTSETVIESYIVPEQAEKTL